MTNGDKSRAARPKETGESGNTDILHGFAGKRWGFEANPCRRLPEVGLQTMPFDALLRVAIATVLFDGKTENFENFLMRLFCFTGVVHARVRHSSRGQVNICSAYSISHCARSRKCETRQRPFSSTIVRY